jgi:hypothetical protein
MAIVSIDDWNRKNRFDGEYFFDLLEEKRITKLYSYRRNAIEYSRTKYNRLDYEGQKEYEAKLNKEKFAFAFSIDNDSSYFEIPKEVFNYAMDYIETDYDKIPEIVEKDFYIKY